MGTLTADVPRLDSHCPHKLATSCRLTSTPNCCACADERQHSRTYRVYIDGVGFVQRGTRWQGYCWFCKEFWSNRLAATDPPLDISQTRIPQIPDQTEFLNRWNEFHQGYRVARLADGSEQRIAVLGEPFKEVSPGFLPRSLDQLRAGVENDARRPENRFQRRRLSEEEQRPEAPQQSLEDALDSLLEEESSADNEIMQTQGQSSSVPLAPVELDSPEPARPFTRREAQQQRRREQFQRVFGSREDLQQEDYESPLTSLYSRAYDRYRQAEERRADGTTIAPAVVDSMSVQERRDIEEQLLWGVMRDSQAMSEELEREGDVWSYSPIPVGDRSTVSTDMTGDDLMERHMLEVNALLQQSHRAYHTPAQAHLDLSTTTPTTESIPNVLPVNMAPFSARPTASSDMTEDVLLDRTSPSTNEQIVALLARYRRAEDALAQLSTRSAPRSITGDSGLNAWLNSTGSSSPSSTRPTVQSDAAEDVPLDRTDSSRQDTLVSLVEQFTNITSILRNRTRDGDLARTTPTTTAAPNSPLIATAPSSSSTSSNTRPQTTLAPPTLRNTEFSELYTSLAHMTSELARLRLVSDTLAATTRRSTLLTPATPPTTLDNQPGRPPPKTDGEMTKILACQVCYQQLADTAVLPCGHMVMCGWCADVVVPVRHSHIPVGVVKCPMCRKIVKQRFKIHM
ncbi:hypothetical protein NX059_000279 [Plenodomus lindquistii]|nr:hypothetical protein NX059_000279 [Plenodomus lindquistii]